MNCMCFLAGIIINVPRYIEATKKMTDHNISAKIPTSVYILACIKNNSPLPPEFWRNTIFKKDNK